jgi:RNA polymerase sigma-70 factor (ECF subfamily)
MAQNDRKTQLFLLHRAALVDYATPIVGDRARAEDVVQEAFIRFAPGTTRPEPTIEQPVAYLYRIVRNLAYDLTRRRALEQREQAAEPAWWMLPSGGRTPEQESVHRQEVEQVRAVLAALPPDQRRAVELHRFGGFTLAEVADELGVSIATVHRLVRDALVRIAAELASED